MVFDYIDRKRLSLCALVPHRFYFRKVNKTDSETVTIKRVFSSHVHSFKLCSKFWQGYFHCNNSLSSNCHQFRRDFFFFSIGSLWLRVFHHFERNICHSSWKPLALITARRPWYTAAFLRCLESNIAVIFISHNAKIYFSLPHCQHTLYCAMSQDSLCASCDL